ncbi:hypothetical protein SAMN05421753_111171 [Planctomicrobium piriforme]|uniref:Uncharacterized protein n=2 Tax=Planctomicrobium piriforme TaxID=1576369 RepID=A0A1I3KBM8_9PLAN|nr:hypothetical protein SAMN05421753_111171 [Planctomicrobium piriforme]
MSQTIAHDPNALSADSPHRVPWQVEWFITFSVVVSVLEPLLTFVSAFKFTREALLPITGWSSPFYLFAALMFPFLGGHHSTTGSIRGYLRFCRRLMVIALVFGIVDFVRTNGQEDFGNPYLIVSSWRPTWTIAVPFFWLTMLWIARTPLPKPSPDFQVHSAHQTNRT